MRFLMRSSVAWRRWCRLRLGSCRCWSWARRFGRALELTTALATFAQRLSEEAIKFKEAAEQQPAGSSARELLLRRAGQAETASHINNWLSSPGLQPPKALNNLVVDQKK
jgi:hypothetical protein